MALKKCNFGGALERDDVFSLCYDWEETMYRHKLAGKETLSFGNAEKQYDCVDSQGAPNLSGAGKKPKKLQCLGTGIHSNISIFIAWKDVTETQD